MKYCDPQRVAKGLASQIWLKVGIFCDVVHCCNTLKSMYTTVQKFGGSKKEINILIKQGSIKLVKSDSKGFYNITKDFNFK